MRYLSVCSGIESATVAWHPLGWEPVAFAEIDRFPSAVLAYRYPEVRNLGDFTQITRDDLGADIDLLVGGTPCQDFSVAGLRAGLDGDRGNLSLEFLRLADRLRPRWLVWENVPGVLSSNGGRDFGSILGGMVELGYGFAYRVLDAQYIRVDGYARAVPQRRRRVFVVGYLGDWRRAAAVLFERESLQGNPAPRREAGQGTAPTLAARTRGGGGLGTDFDLDGGQTAVPLNDLGGASHALTARHSATGRYDPNGETWIAFSSKDHGGDAMENLSPTLRAMGHDGSHANAGGQIAVAHTLKGGGFDASEDGTGRGVPIVPIAFDTTQITSADNRCNPQPGDPCHPIPAHGHAPAIAFDMRGREGGAMPEGPHETANIRASSGGSSRSYLAYAMQAVVTRENPASGPDGVGVQEGIAYTLEARAEVQAVASQWAVRRLMPVECERLQGFPDGYTDIPWRGGRAPDGPRYKALGNSMSVNCMRWIGERIDMVEKIIQQRRAA